MRYLIATIFLFAMSLHAEDRPPSSILDNPGGTGLNEPEPSSTPQPVLDYTILIEEISKIRQNPNQIRSEYDLDLLEEEVKGRLFRFQDTIIVKTDALVSQNRGFWFTPHPSVESFLQMPDELKREYSAVQEFDFITARAICVSIGKVCRFKAVAVEGVEPFDPSAEFHNYTDFIQEQDKLRKDLPYFEYKTKLKRESEELRNVLGHVTGKVTALKKGRNNTYVMTMEIGEEDNIFIECHPAYLNVLLDLEMNSRVSMAALLDRADVRDGYFFKRGCMIRLRD